MVPDIQNSDKYKALLTCAQSEFKDVLRIPGFNYQRVIDTLLKHLSFAKQRFDSFATPAAKAASMLMPNVAVLCLIASDARIHQDKRTNARALVQKFTSELAEPLPKLLLVPEELAASLMHNLTNSDCTPLHHAAWHGYFGPSTAQTVNIAGVVKTI